jgi:hypothetical protein
MFLNVTPDHYARCNGIHLALEINSPVLSVCAAILRPDDASDWSIMIGDSNEVFPAAMTLERAKALVLNAVKAELVKALAAVTEELNK